MVSEMLITVQLYLRNRDARGYGAYNIDEQTPNRFKKGNGFIDGNWEMERAGLERKLEVGRQENRNYQITKS